MQWLNKILDDIATRKREKEILVESGISPSGRYHLGYLREILICDAILLELKYKKILARHVHFVDDQDAFRKIPKDLPGNYEKYLGKPLCDIPAPDSSGNTYADYRLIPFLSSMEKLGVDMDIIRSNVKYKNGYFTSAIEKILEHSDLVKEILETISGHKIGQEWSPIQVNEGGYLKKRPFIAINKSDKTIRYEDKDGLQKEISYANGLVKLDWRLDWPARWWLQKVDVEPFGRDHATKGGSYDTGSKIIEEIFSDKAPLPVPYEFINRAGENKKMSASVGNVIEVSQIVDMLPPEVIRFFILQSRPSKTLFFNAERAYQLIDEYAGLLAKNDKNSEDLQLIRLSNGKLKPTISSFPFTLLVELYQTNLKDIDRTIQRIRETHPQYDLESEMQILIKELKYINYWLNVWAPEELKFSIVQDLDKVYKTHKFSQLQKTFLNSMANEIMNENPNDGDGDWFHKTIYKLKEELGIENSKAFEAIYYLLIGKSFGPRAGRFLSIQPKDWLIKRLRFEE